MESLTGSGGVSSQLLKQAEIGDEIPLDTEFFKEFTGKAYQVSGNRSFDIYLVNLFRTDKENMIGLNGIFTEIDHVFSGPGKRPYHRKIVVPVRLFGRSVHCHHSDFQWSG